MLGIIFPDYSGYQPGIQGYQPVINKIAEPESLCQKVFSFNIHLFTLKVYSPKFV
jgi:hypothetical protein